MIVRIDLASEVPVYRQIADAVRVYLVEGVLAPGDPLPTIRQLALDLGVHFNTVAEAYRLLSEEGWLELRRRRGALVLRRRRPAVLSGDLAKEYTARFRELVARARADGLAAKQVADLLGRLREELES